MSLPRFQDLSFTQWEQSARELGFGTGQLRKFFRTVHSAWPASWDEVDLPKRQVAKIASRYSLAVLPSVVSRTGATDGTTKFLLGLADGNAVEAVYIPDEERGTVCLSSQVGCAMDCAFCFTAKMGLKRHLAVHEIVGQWLRVREEMAGKPFTNIVFMGMGEPLHNLENLLAALEIFTHDYGLQVPSRRITVSTSGLLPAIKELFARSTVRLALSVNGATPEGRKQVMPVERAYPIKDVLDFLRAREKGNHHDVMFEYVLLGGVNDRDEDAADLLRLLDGVPGRVNLIPFNAHPGGPYERPEREHVFRFHKLIREGGRNVFIRDSKGRDVLAACGQLHHAESARKRGDGSIHRAANPARLHREPSS